MTSDPNAQAGADPALQDQAGEPTPIPTVANDEAPKSQPSVEQLERERDEMRDRWMRAGAEIANVRARAKRDVDDTRQYAVQKFAADVVEAAENLRRGLASLPPASEGEPDIVTKFRDGLQGVERSFVGILERNGIKSTDPTGQPFDANLHQAMSEAPSSEHPPGTVVQAYTQAWTLHGRLLKPAMVVVAKRTGQEAA